MTQEEILQAIQGLEPDEFAELLSKQAQAHFQPVFRKGYGIAKEEFSRRVQEMETRSKTLSEALEKANEDLKALRESTPNVEKVQEEKEKMLLEKERQKQEALTRAEQEWRGKVDDLSKQLRSTLVENERARIVNSLQSLGVDPYVAESVVLRPEVSRRFSVQDGGVVRYYQPDGSTPFLPDHGSPSAESFAKVLVAEGVVPRQYVQQPRKSGGAGSRFDGSGGGGPTTITMADLQKGNVDLEKVASGEIRVADEN